MICIIGLLWETVFSRATVPEPEVVYQPFHSFKNLIYYIKLYGIRTNLIGNILLFIPIGILVPMVGKWSERWYKTSVCGFCLSFVIESIQGITGKGYFDYDDLVLNTIGTMIGWGIWKMIIGLYDKYINKRENYHSR